MDKHHVDARTRGRDTELRLLIADDQALVRGALAALLDAEPGMRVVAQVGTGAAVIDTLSQVDVDVVLMDIEMPDGDGIWAVEALRDRGYSCEVLMVTTFGRPGYVRRALDAGALGFVVKDTPAHELAEAIRAVAGGRVVVDPDLAHASLSEGRSPLSPREADMLRLAHSGASIRSIAEQAFLSPGTVRNHLSSAIGKTGTSNHREAATFAMEQGWL